MLSVSVLFVSVSLTAEPQPVWVPGGTVIPEEASPPGKAGVYWVNECFSPPPLWSLCPELEAGQLLGHFLGRTDSFPT